MVDQKPTDGAPTLTRRVFRCVDLIDELAAWVDAAHDAMESGAPRGPQVVFPKFAEITGGCLAPGVHVLHGAPNAGKSAFAGMLVAGCATPSLTVSTEMTPRELFLRQIARTRNLSLPDLLSGRRTGAEIRRFAKMTAAEIPQMCILDATATQVSAAEIQREARDLRNDAGHLLLVLDSLHSWARRNVEGAEYDRMTAAASAFEQLAAAEKVPVLVIAERSRSAMQTGGMHAAKGTASIEYSARSVWSLNVCGDSTLDRNGSISLSLDIEKNKDGVSCGSVQFAFTPAYMRFREI